MESDPFDILFPVIIFCFAVYINAKKMGYSGLLWFLVSFLYLPISPIALLYILASLPNKSLDKKRKQEMCLLQKQLAQKRYPATDSSSVIWRRRSSDDQTIR